MIKLTWIKDPAIDKTMLNGYINKIQSRASQNNMFAIMLPIGIYKHIKKEGINAKLTQIPCEDVLPPNMVLALVEQLED